MCWQWSGYVCPLSWDEVAKKCLWCLSLTKCYNAKHLDQSSQMKIPHLFLVRKCFESFQLPPNYPTNQLTKYSWNHLLYHPTIQIFNHPHQPSMHSAFPPSNQFTIQVSNHPSITPCPGSVGRLSLLTTFLVWITVCPGSCGFL